MHNVTKPVVSHVYMHFYICVSFRVNKSSPDLWLFSYCDENSRNTSLKSSDTFDSMFYLYPKSNYWVLLEKNLNNM